MTTEQMTKLRKDLEVVQANMDVFAEILSDLKPGQEKPADLELLEELHVTCKEMQNRIGDLLSQVTTDELTGQLLHLNDELNNLFLRFKKNREKNSICSPPPSTKESESEPSLIDFGPTEEVTKTLETLNMNKNIASSCSATPSAAPMEDDTALVLGHRQSDFDEMEAWLKANPGSGGTTSANRT